MDQQMTAVAQKHQCTPERARLFWTWIQGRGGVAVWGCLDLARAGQTWSSPAMNVDGVTPTGKVSWASTNKPIAVYTNGDDIEVMIPKEVKRFHVAVQRGSGYSVVLTDGSTRKVRQEMKKHGDDAWYEMDYRTQECVVYVADGKMTLTEWARENVKDADAVHTEN